MTTLTARHPQRPLRSGKPPRHAPDAAGPLPSQPPLSDAPSSATSAYTEVDRQPLAQLAMELALSHRLADRQGRNPLLARLDDNRRVLQDAFDRLRRAAAEQSTIPPAGAWLVDNFSRLRELMRSARRDLRNRRLRELPCLFDVSGECLPRVYCLARELIAHLDAQFEQESLQHFFSAYQAVTPLTLAELWSVCGMLRLGLIDHLSRLAKKQGAWSREQGVRLPATGSPLPAFTPPPSSWVPGPLPAPCPNEAADELSIKQCILSLTELAMLDWKEFVECQSVVEHVLREDPAGIHPRMSFASRDHYRRIVQKIARCCPLDEEQVARAAIEHARLSDRGAAAAAAEPAGTARADGRANVKRHVGYYLVDRGRAALEAGIGYRPTRIAALGRFAGQAPLASYLGAILLVWLLTVLAAAALGMRLEIVRTAGPAAALVLLALFAGAAAQFAQAW